jgi:cell division protein FtsB
VRMENDMYHRPKKSVRTFINRLRKKPRDLLMFFVLLFVGLYVLFNNKGVVTRIRLELERREAAEKLNNAERETEQLQQYLKALEGDKKTIEKVARERHGMAREGETVYRVKKD